MLGSRYCAHILVDGEVFDNELIHGESDNDKKQLIIRVLNEFKSVMVPKWMAQHNVRVIIYDRLEDKVEEI